jgi:hypothetical protein
VSIVSIRGRQIQRPENDAILARSVRWSPRNGTNGRFNFSNVIEMNAKRKNRWSAAVTRRSDALDLENGVFKMSNPRRIALSLKHSAEHSHRRKARPFQSAMSMVNFYINRAGSGLSARQKNILTHAKEELRRVFHKPVHSTHHPK